MIDAREARASRGVLNEQRAERGKHVSRGQYLNYYDDLGFSSTEEGHKGIMEDERVFQGNVKEQRGSIDKSQASVNTARASADSQYHSAYKDLSSQKFQPLDAKSTANTVWSKAEKFPVRVVKGNTIEHTYYLSPSQAHEVASKWNGGEGNYYSGFVDGGRSLNVDISRSGGGHVAHTTLGTAQDSYKSGVYTSAYNEVAKVNTANQKIFNTQMKSAYGTLEDSYAEANKSLAESQGLVNKATGDLRVVTDKREAEWKMLRGDYQNKLSNMREIFGALSIEEG